MEEVNGVAEATGEEDLFIRTYPFVPVDVLLSPSAGRTGDRSNNHTETNSHACQVPW